VDWPDGSGVIIKFSCFLKSPLVSMIMPGAWPHPAKAKASVKAAQQRFNRLVGFLMILPLVCPMPRLSNRHKLSFPQPVEFIKEEFSGAQAAPSLKLAKAGL